MPARDYLKVAAAQLHKASESLKDQARGLMSERDRRATQRAHEISRHQLDIRVKQAEISMRDDQYQKARLAQEVKHIQQQITAKQREVQQLTDQFTRTARNKEQHSAVLYAKARDLEMQAGAPELSD